MGDGFAFPTQRRIVLLSGRCPWLGFEEVSMVSDVRRVASLAAALALAALCFAAFGSTSAHGAASVKIPVPSAIKAKGTLTVAADATYAPNEFVASNGHTVIGMDPDLAKALGQVLGLKVKVVNATFDSIIP